LYKLSDEEDQWKRWSAKHPNPSGLPVNDPRLKGQSVDKFHHEVTNLKLVPLELAAIRWVGSPNYSPNRDGHNVDWTPADPTVWIVLHTMDGTLANTIVSFGSVARQASSTYGIGLDGSIVQFVKETDAAWANGTYADNPGSNLDSISIEHEDDGDFNGPRTLALYMASAQLVADISKRHSIPLVHQGTGGGVLRHKECNGASTACPDSLNVDWIIARAIAVNSGRDWTDAELLYLTTVFGWVDIKNTLGATLYNRAYLLAHPAPPVVVPPVVPPVVVPPVVPPIIVPPVTPPVVVPPIVDPTPTNLWDAIVAFFRKWFTGK
jgi:hypothetical protein